MAAAGSLTMAAVKRDRGELVTGNFVEGHGGVLSRIDSICFAAPVFYHVSRYFFAA
jgi:phosphatidate cytidylyltransferase